MCFSKTLKNAQHAYFCDQRKEHNDVAHQRYKFPHNDEHNDTDLKRFGLTLHKNQQSFSETKNTIH